jgi:hypothetical protein
MATDTTPEPAPVEAAPEIPSGASLDWTEPAPAAAAPEPTVEADVADESVLNLPLARKGYILGLEAELVFYGSDPERKAAITAELERVRGGQAVAPEKETR